MDQKLLKSLYREMVRIRLVEEAIAGKYGEQEMRCPVHLSIGQEGVAVGVGAALDASDAMMSTHRAHAHYLAKGGSLKAMLSELYGKASGCCGGVGGSMHLIDLDVNMLGSTSIVGGTIPVAVGAAFALKLQKVQNKAVCVFMGEGATEEGVFFESINFAALKSLPVLFICENNLYSVYSPLSVRQPSGRNRIELARHQGLYVDSGDGNNVEEVYEKVALAAKHVKGGNGPAFLEFSTYRWREHCGPNYDNNIGYRTEAEFEAWKEKCPIRFLEERLLRSGDLTEQELSDMKAQIFSEIEDAFVFAKKSPFPEAEMLYKNTYPQKGNRA